MVIDKCIEYDIIPFVTLYHFDLPYALVAKINKFGWKREIVHMLLNGMLKYVLRTCDRVKYWVIHKRTKLNDCVLMNV